MNAFALLRSAASPAGSERRRRFASFLLAVLPLITAATGSARASSDVKAKRPDFSKQALQRLFIVEGPQHPITSPFDTGIILFNGPRVHVRWMPFVAPLVVSNTSGSQGIVQNPMVDPFVLTGTSYASTPRQSRDRFRDWRERRALLRYAAHVAP